MSNGTSGDVNNINFREKGETRPPYEKMREVADEVADAVYESHQQLEFRDWVPLAAARGTSWCSPSASRRPKQLAYAEKVLEAEQGRGAAAAARSIYADAAPAQ